MTVDVLFSFVEEHHRLDLAQPFLNLMRDCKLAGKALAKALVCVNHRCSIEEVVVSSLVDVPDEFADNFTVLTEELGSKDVAKAGKTTACLWVVVSQQVNYLNESVVDRVQVLSSDLVSEVFILTSR